MTKKTRVSTAKSSRSKTATPVAKRAAPKKKPPRASAPAPRTAAPAPRAAAPVPKLTAPKPAVSKPAEALQNGSKRFGEYAEYRELLHALRARVRGDVEQMTTEALDRNGEGMESKSPTHLAELGTETYEQDFALRRVENEQELLDEIDHALARIEHGTYGLCLSCVESGVAPSRAQIPKARLRVIPYARNCVECERKRERWGR